MNQLVEKRERLGEKWGKGSVTLSAEIVLKVLLQGIYYKVLLMVTKQSYKI